MDKSFDEEDSVPHLPDDSVGSSVSTDLENEYNDLLQYTVVLPVQYDLNCMPKVLENSKGLFSTYYKASTIPANLNDTDKQSINLKFDNELEENKTNEGEFLKNHTEASNRLRAESFIKNNFDKADASYSSDYHLPIFDDSINSNTTNTSNNSKKKSSVKDFNQDVDLNENRSLLRIFTDSMSPLNKETPIELNDQLNDKQNEISAKIMFNQPKPDQQDQYQSSGIGTVISSTASMINTPTSSSDLISSTDNFVDTNPRVQLQNLLPASPPNNIELDMSSIETINNNYDLTSNNSKNSSEFKSNTSIADINEDVHSLLNQNNNQELIRDHFQVKNTNNTTKSNKISAKNPPSINTVQSVQNKNVKIASCLDKWYKELKGNVLSEFEKSRVQFLQDQQKQLIDEKERQASEIIKLRKELEMARETLKVYERNTLKRDETVQSLTKALEKQSEKMDLQRVMLEWKIDQVENAKESFTTQLAKKYYNQRIKLKTFLNWHLFIANKQKSKFEKSCKKKAEEICVNLATKYENRIKCLEEEMSLIKLDMEKNNLQQLDVNNNLTADSNYKSPPYENLDQNLQHNLDKPQTKYADASNALHSKRSKSKSSFRNASETKKYVSNNNSENNLKDQYLNQVSKSDLNKNMKLHHYKVNFGNSINCIGTKVFDELTQHTLSNQKEISIKSNISKSDKSKKKSELQISIPTSNGLASIRQSLPPYRSIIIEKHGSPNDETKFQQHKNQELIKSTTTTVKYNSPGQPANVLRTVITSSSN